MIYRIPLDDDLERRRARRSETLGLIMFAVVFLAGLVALYVTAAAGLIGGTP